MNNTIQTYRAAGALALLCRVLAGCGSSTNGPSSGSDTSSGSAGGETVSGSSGSVESVGSASAGASSGSTSGANSGGTGGANSGFASAGASSGSTGGANSGSSAAGVGSGSANAGASSAGASGVPSSGSGGSSGAGGATGSAGAGATGTSTGSSGNPSACTLAQRLRGGPTCHFLFGTGNDLASDHNEDGAYTLGTTIDLHYAYLVGLPTMGGWPDWNANGGFIDILADAADTHGVTPMFTLYAMASEGDGNFAMTTDDTAMNLYWQGARLLFQRLAAFNKPAVVHLEPDFWGYAMQQSADGTAKVIVAEHASECASEPDNLIGMAGCLITLARMYAPKVAIGFHASAWGGSQAQVISFFQAIHADHADFIATDVIDRDAGCYEAGTDPNCKGGGGGSPWYWDETNQTSPNFHDNLTWVKGMHDALNLPIVWWQLPLGVPSSSPGGTGGHYRDNRVHYIFQHVDEYAAAGGVAAVFGTGAANQTDVTTDGGQFKAAVASYFAKPLALQ
jgi:hypothetical protein